MGLSVHEVADEAEQKLGKESLDSGIIWRCGVELPQDGVEGWDWIVEGEERNQTEN
jgi:hypothetical protein